MTTYNPFSAALEALTCEDAKSFYSVRAQSDTQAVIDTALTVGIGVYQLCAFVYALGALAGEAHYSAVTTHTAAAEPVQSAQPCLPTPKAIAYLPPAKSNDVEVSVTRLIECLEDTDTFRHESYLKLTKRQLIERCISLGLKARKSMKKSELVEALMA